MRCDRRRMLALAGSAALAGLIAPGSRAGGAPGVVRRLFIAANAAGEGDFRLAALTPDGERVFEFPLPGRGHGIALRPGVPEAVAIARRPGRFARVFDLRDGARIAELAAPAGRHFYGHGVYARDGSVLFTTENDFDAGRGVIGLWDGADGYRRIGEWASHGIGPHELVLLGDGRTLAVANGGILTAPDTGRRKLNIPTMTPTLAYIDARDGGLIAALGFDDRRRRLLSIRHLAVGRDDTVCIALQDQGPAADRMPLVAFHRRGEATLDLHAAPGAMARRMKGYAGAAAVDAGGRLAAVSAPRGGLVTFWDVARRALLGATTLADGCGVAAEGAPGRFVLTSGGGGARRYDARTGRAAPLAGRFVAGRRWDNHIVAR